MPWMTEEEKYQNWSNFINDFFENEVPRTKEWIGLDNIAFTLNKIGFNNSGAYNHTFLPGGGGMDLLGAKKSDIEQGCLEVDFGTPYILKPLKLTFNSFDSGPEWFYFRLETAHLKPSGVYEEISDDAEYEEVCELPGGEYIDRGYYDHGYYGTNEYGDELRLPKETRVVSRYLKGSFVIFGKFSPYNKVSSTYDGRHDKMTSDQFKKFIQTVIDRLKMD